MMQKERVKIAVPKGLLDLVLSSLIGGNRGKGNRRIGTSVRTDIEDSRKRGIGKNGST
jgi:hypothetical protein